MSERKYHKKEELEEGITYVKYASFEPTEEEFEVYLNDLYTIYNQDKRFVIVLDGSDAKYLSSNLRIRQGEWLNKHSAVIKKNCITQVFVIPNIIVKMILQGIFLVQKPIVPHIVINKKDEALKKAREIYIADKTEDSNTF